MSVAISGVPVLNEPEKEIYDHMSELEKLGGSAAYLDAVATAPLLLSSVSDDEVNPFGLLKKVPLMELDVASKWGKIHFTAVTEDNHGGNGRGLGFISTDIYLKNQGTLHYSSWRSLLAADSFKIAGAKGTVFIYFSSDGLPAGFIKAPGEFGAVGGKGSCNWEYAS